MFNGVFTHADGSRVSIAIIRVCDFVCDFICLSEIKNKTAETEIAKLCTEIAHQLVLGLKVVKVTGSQSAKTY